MTTVSRFSLASELLCFSRFDEGEYILLKLVSHGIERADHFLARFAPVARASRAPVNSHYHDESRLAASRDA